MNLNGAKYRAWQAVLPPPNSAIEAKLARREEFDEFWHTLEQLTPRTWASYALIGANCFVFVLMALNGVSVFDPSTADLVAWGAEYAPKTLAGEWWRLFSSQFVHVGIFHLALNMCAFAYIAQTAERAIGNVNFLLLYLVSGLAGGLLALHFDPLAVHAGASGAIFGVYGALLGFVLVQRRSIPRRPAASLLSLVLIFIVYNLVYSSLRTGISLAAHVGGLIVGFVCGMILAQPLSRASLAGRPLRGLLLSLLGAALMGAGIYVAHNEYPALDRLTALVARFRALDAADDALFTKAWEENVPNNMRDLSTNELLRESVAQLTDDSKRLGDAAFADLIEHNLLSKWRPLTTDLEGYTPVPQRFDENFREIVDYAKQRQKEWELLVEGLRKADKHIVGEGKSLQWQTSDARRRFRYNALVYPAAN
jgi:membrane associated rhomboid family serine protease